MGITHSEKTEICTTSTAHELVLRERTGVDLILRRRLFEQSKQCEEIGRKSSWYSSAYVLEYYMRECDYSWQIHVYKWRESIVLSGGWSENSCRESLDIFDEYDSHLACLASGIFVYSNSQPIVSINLHFDSADEKMKEAFLKRIIDAMEIRIKCSYRRLTEAAKNKLIEDYGDNWVESFIRSASNSGAMNKEAYKRLTDIKMLDVINHSERVS